MSDLHYFKSEWVQKSDERLTVDVCIYGGTSAGVSAAVTVARAGKSVVILNPAKAVGGLTTGGLGETDFGRKHVIGGFSREFYRAAGKHYGLEEEFKFEPHVASAVFEAMLKEHQIDVRPCQFIDRAETQGGRIIAVTMLGGLRVEASVFIDATYEGDLLAKAGVSYFVGREDNSVYGETLSGVQVTKTHQFSHPVDPYVKPGDSASGLLPYIVNEDLNKSIGKGDKRVQAYCFRMCMTNDPSLRIAWEKPEGYDPAQYVLAARWFAGEKDDYNDLLSSTRPEWNPRKFDKFPNKTPGGFRKTDTNNHGPISSDFIGANHEWPDGSYERREEIFQAHVTYQKGYYWFMANSPEIPERYRAVYNEWGLPNDEFDDTNHWPHALYVREARRMVGDYVITEHDCRGVRVPTDVIGMGSYGMDSHNCSRFVTIGDDGKARVLNDGDVQVHGFPPYGVPYRCITPKRTECTNLLVPTCVSSSHIAYGSARMEPVFMVLGQSAATAACMAIDAKSSVQDVPYGKLRERLLAAGQVLENTGG
ncbi:MAG TPA: FAD-dependent oxidoreductase [Tepidisphaeraceae bacterium]|jgi:hypothetical protein|nr:FAD-dependent oxidoreductase [Tepidisphaeraceae bacterium]